MTDPAPTILAVSTLLGVIGGLFLSWRNGRKSDTVVAAIDNRATALDTKVAEVHGLADGNLSRMALALEVANARNEVANARNEGLSRLIASMAENKVVADQVAATLAAATSKSLSETPPEIR